MESCRGHLKLQGDGTRSATAWPRAPVDCGALRTSGRTVAARGSKPSRRRNPAARPARWLSRWQERALRAREAAAGAADPETGPAAALNLTEVTVATAGSLGPVPFPRSYVDDQPSANAGCESASPAAAARPVSRLRRMLVFQRIIIETLPRAALLSSAPQMRADRTEFIAGCGWPSARRRCTTSR